MKYKKAISPVSNSYLTKGKQYDIVWIDEDSEQFGKIFFILDDQGHNCVCIEKGQMSTGGLSWELK